MPQNSTLNYDIVCAISEKAINAALVKLFAQRPSSTGKIRWHNADVSEGEIISTLLAPQIQLDVESVDSLKFKLKLRFGEGQISFGQDTYQTIDNWVIVFNLVWPRSPTVNVTAAAAAELENTAEIVDSNQENSIDLSPGEYSIHRLLAIVAYLDWDTPIWNESYLTKQDGTNATKVYLDQWAKDSSNNPLYSQVQEFMRHLGPSEKHASLLMQNMRMEVPRAKVSPEKASFPSRVLRLQQYPFATADRRDALRNAGTPPTGTNGNPYNCLCFCEMVGDNWVLPNEPLRFCGNFAWPNDASDLGDDERLGTFSCRVSPPLPTIPAQLQKVCVASFVVPLRAEWESGIFKDKFAYPDFSDRHQYGDDSYFALARQGTNRFHWEVELVPPGSNWPVARPGSNLVLYEYVIAATSSVTFEQLSDSDPKLTGNCHYDCRVRSWPPNGSGVAIKDDYSFDLSWNITIDANNFKPDSSTAMFGNCSSRVDEETGEEMLTPLDLTQFVAENPYQKEWNSTEYQKKPLACFRYEYSKRVSRALKELSSDLNARRSIYSGSRDLSFGPGYIDLTSENHTFSSVDYLEPDMSRVTWVPSQANTPQDTKTETSVIYASDTSVTQATPHITWTSSVAYDTAAQKATLTLQGSNDSNANVAFKSVKATFLRMKNINGLPLWKASSDSWGQDTTTDSTWSITRDKIAQNLQTKVEIVNDELQFNICPLGSAGYADPDRFIIARNGSFTLNLSGTVNTDGKDDNYIVQLTEDWASPVVIKPLSGRADTFLVVDLKPDGSSTTPYITTQNDADMKRGVPQN